MPSLRLASFDEMVAALAALEKNPRATGGGWTLPQVLIHIAQGIDYSITGYPAMRSSLFRNTIGRIARRRFLGKGQMTHDLQAPIPGAPELPASATTDEATARLQQSIANFRGLAAAPAPHFAYGPLDKAQYERIHAMHLANHLSNF